MSQLWHNLNYQGSLYLKISGQQKNPADWTRAGLSTSVKLLSFLRLNSEEISSYPWQKKALCNKTFSESKAISFNNGGRYLYTMNPTSARTQLIDTRKKPPECILRLFKITVCVVFCLSKIIIWTVQCILTKKCFFCELYPFSRF